MSKQNPKIRVLPEFFTRICDGSLEFLVKKKPILPGVYEVSDDDDRSCKIEIVLCEQCTKIVKRDGFVAGFKEPTGIRILSLEYESFGFDTGENAQLYFGVHFEDTDKLYLHKVVKLSEDAGEAA